MNIKKLNIAALDGYKLGSLVLTPEIKSRGVIQFHNGASAVKEFYLNFCSHLCDAGYTVIMFDYRGIGESRPDSLKNFKGSIGDWGMLDMPGILKWVNINYPNEKKFIVAHSMGGQIIGLMNNINLVDAIVSIGSSYGNWKNYSGKNKYISAITLFGYFPIALKLFGYLPLKKLGKGEDLPLDAGKELMSWCKGNNIHSKIMNQNKIPNYYHDIKKSIKAYFLEDDNIATAKTIPMYKADFSNALLYIEIIKPSEVGVDKIGHYGFFSEKVKNKLWNKPLEWIEKF